MDQLNMFESNQSNMFSDRPFKSPCEAFDNAIKEGRLSDNPNADNYAGKYMYMGPSLQGNKDAFKNIETRQYLK